MQKQKQTDEEYGRKLQEFQAELASSNELRQKLQREVRQITHNSFAANLFVEMLVRDHSDCDFKLNRFFFFQLFLFLLAEG